MPLSFFDANVVVGIPRNGSLFQPVPTPADLTAYLDTHGFQGALVWHWAQAETHPATGNQLLRPYLADRPAIYPCWALLPPATDEPLGLPGALMDALPAAVRLFPGAHRYQMERVVWDGLLDELVARRVPVLLSLEHEVDWRQIYDLLRDYPRLTCILCDVGAWSMDRYTYPLLAAYPNVHVETSMLSLEDGGVESLVSRFGAGRAVFGTGFPKRYAEAPMLQLTHAAIAELDKQAIAAGNMLQLLGGTTHA
jgi:hypothetical protein